MPGIPTGFVSEQTAAREAGAFHRGFRANGIHLFSFAFAPSVGPGAPLAAATRIRHLERSTKAVLPLRAKTQQRR